MESFQLITTLRYDPALLLTDWNTRLNNGIPTPIMLLPYHADRLVHAATVHSWPDASRTVTIQSLASACDEAVRRFDALNDADKNDTTAYKVPYSSASSALG